MSLKSVTRKGATISATAIAALALASCSAGQITQTSSQVAAVDGSDAESADGNIAVRDVAIQVEPDTNEASLKFTALNQAYTDEQITALDESGAVMCYKGDPVPDLVLQPSYGPHTPEERKVK